ncbi:RHS repeat-associated core domain-containing protein [Streptomyces sp. NPDC091368]|uniref:RHS repeat-associated core domain-containing protein n=1 Tax=Streptomyces sp. NPDC091368 TaxID=3365993 RepID=UPI0038140D6F
MRNEGKPYCNLTDATGKVLDLVDEAGKRTHTYVHTAYGTEYSDPVETFAHPALPLRRRLPRPTGLYTMGACSYAPHLGRFTQPDPSGQQANPYLYTVGDPISHIDPSGLGMLSCVGGVLSNVGGAGAGGRTVATEFGSARIATPAALGIAGAGLGAIGAGLGMIDDCSS